MAALQKISHGYLVKGAFISVVLCDYAVVFAAYLSFWHGFAPRQQRVPQMAWQLFSPADFSQRKTLALNGDWLFFWQATT